MTAYYNENDKYAAQWLRNLIAARHIAPGDVDERSIRDVKADDLKGYTQCHFFAGIGVWSYALRRAGWPDDREVWTGSAPCQPWSVAGRQGGVDDDRHLWPVWFPLIRERRPAVVFGEQVASKPGLGWLDLVYADLESANYAVGTADICAAGVGAPHIRQRLWFVADARRDSAESGRPNSERAPGRDEGEAREWQRVRAEYSTGSTTGRLDHHHHPRLEGLGGGHQAKGQRNGAVRPVAPSGESGGVEHPDGRNASTEREQRGGEQRQQPEDGGAGGVADPNGRVRREGECAQSEVHQGSRIAIGAGVFASQWPSPTNGHWRDADWLHCRDGKWRPVESTNERLVDGLAESLGYVRTGPDTFGLSPLIKGAKNRVGRLRAYGNAIVAPVAEAFIRAYLDCRP